MLEHLIPERSDPGPYLRLSYGGTEGSNPALSSKESAANLLRAADDAKKCSDHRLKAMLWMRLLTRRSQKDRTGWDRINRLADQWLPKPRILHPWPNQRFAVKHPRWEPDAGCVRRSWYELASASLVRPKPSKQDGSGSYGRHGNVGSGAWTAVGRGVGLTPEIGLSRRPSWRPHQRRQHIRSRYARGRMHRRGLRPGHVRTAHTGT